MQVLSAKMPCATPREAHRPARAARKPATLRVRASAAADQDASGIISGEWPATWSLASYDDLSEYLTNKFIKEDVKKQVSSVMKTKVCSVSPDAPLTADLFTSYSGLPVVDGKGMLIGVVTKKDLDKGGKVVGDVMNSRPIAAKPTAKVSDCAVLMLKHKVHRIPIVDESARLKGIVTRTDIFQSLEGM